MVSHHPARFSGHRQCGIGDAMFLVVEEQDSISHMLSLKSAITICLCLKHVAKKHMTCKV